MPPLDLRADNTNRPIGPNVRVTDILIRGGGGTITFSDGVTVEYVFQFKQDPSIPSGGLFDITLQGERAKRVYQNVVTQAVCDMVDWLLQCSSLNARVSVLELRAGLATEFAFAASDWMAGVQNEITIVQSGVPGAGQLGPHNFPIGRAYHISIFRQDGPPVLTGVDVEVKINLTSGDITIKKAGLGQPFPGRVIISSV